MRAAIGDIGLCVCVRVCVCDYSTAGCRVVAARVCQHVFVSAAPCWSSWWSLTGITTGSELYFLPDSCRRTTFDLRLMLQMQRLHSNRCIGTSSHIHIFTFFDGRPEAASASPSCGLLVLLTFLLS